MTNGWKVYYPEDGETLEDAHDLPTCIDWYDASHEAVEYDYAGRDGWERGVDREFKMIVVSPTGEERRFTAWNEASVDHQCREDDE